MYIIPHFLSYGLPFAPFSVKVENAVLLLLHGYLHITHTWSKLPYLRNCYNSLQIEETTLLTVMGFHTFLTELHRSINSDDQSACRCG